MIRKISSLCDKDIDTSVVIRGWVHSIRRQKKINFLKVSDGSIFTPFQIVSTNSLPKDCYIGGSVEIHGILVNSPGKEQAYEIKAQDVRILGTTEFHDPETYPVIGKTKPSLEYLRNIPHFRIRTLTFQAVMCIRNTLSKATHDFFQSRKFQWVHTPLITTSDCEGAGEVFEVVDKSVPLGEFFGTKEHPKHGFLTVSGQLHVETYACSLGNVYTFGPTFRAEHSQTSRHLAEFWMVEPEMINITFEELIDISEEYVKYCVSCVLRDNMPEIQFLNKNIDETLAERLTKISTSRFERVSYDDAIKRLQESDHKIEWGDDLSSEQEKELVANAQRPVIVYKYPAALKAFYMKQVEGRESFPVVECIDLLVPGIGELIGGSMREDNYEKLLNKMKSTMDVSEYGWYLDLRRYGSVPHGGFGVGFERLVMFCSGMKNIRDVIPFPRAYGDMMF